MSKQTEGELARALRIATEVQADPAWRERDETEQYAEYMRRVHTPGQSEEITL